jgi:ABC-type microcin C transport system duplicated ATPase subunit YejF
VSPLLEIRDLEVGFPGARFNRAVRGVSLSIGRGEVVGVVGESGARFAAPESAWSCKNRPVLSIRC